MSERVILEEGGSINVHTRIKDMCRAARNRLGLTNQDISDRIAERFGLEDFSVNTVNNFFSERSKATTIYTTGYICAVLNISMDAVFGIEQSFTTAEEAEFVRQLAELKVEARFMEQENEHLKGELAETREHLSEMKQEQEFYRKEIDDDQKRVQPWVFILTLVLLTCLLGFVIAYLIHFDLRNPDYGFFRQQMQSLLIKTSGFFV